ncbi:hypothetical protein REPUB_Repub17cG0027100 [Reevesia pubescens]
MELNSVKSKWKHFYQATFLDEGYSIDYARQHGHTHLLEIIEHAQWIRNKSVLLTHFSSRYRIEVII